MMWEENEKDYLRNMRDLAHALISYFDVLRLCSGHVFAQAEKGLTIVSSSLLYNRFWLISLFIMVRVLEIP